MSDSFEQKTTEPDFPNRMVYFLALTFVALGILNSTPLIPGWDELWRGITGIEKLKIRTFPTEWFYPLIFSLMMLLVALQHSMWRSWKGTSKAIFGAFMDIALVVSAVAVSITYLIEMQLFFGIRKSF